MYKIEATCFGQNCTNDIESDLEATYASKSEAHAAIEALVAVEDETVKFVIIDTGADPE